jgi:hypothetical protein
MPRNGHHQLSASAKDFCSLPMHLSVPHHTLQLSATMAVATLRKGAQPQWEEHGALQQLLLLPLAPQQLLLLL